MQLITTHLELLLPRESELVLCKYLNLANNFDIRKLWPCTVVKLDNQFILGDGHHRAYYFNLRGMLEIPIMILENDSEVKQCNDGAFYYFDNLGEFIEDYKRFRKPILDKCRIRQIKDYTFPTRNC
jgi:hypothetical protein